MTARFSCDAIHTHTHTHTHSLAYKSMARMYTLGQHKASMKFKPIPLKHIRLSAMCTHTADGALWYNINIIGIYMYIRTSYHIVCPIACDAYYSQ